MITLDKLLPKLAKPAQRALENAGIVSLETLADRQEKEIIALHGIGPNAMQAIRHFLADNRAGFRPD